LCHRLLPRIETSQGQTIEAYEMFSGAAVDFVTAYIFGLKNGSNFIQDPAYCKQYLLEFKSRQKYFFWPHELPQVLDFARMLGLQHRIIPKWVDRCNERLDQWLLDMADGAEKTINDPEALTDPANDPVVYRQLRSSLKRLEGSSDAEKCGDSISNTQRLAIASETQDHALAGIDTTGITLTYLAWELSKPENIQMQARLQKELQSVRPAYRPAMAEKDRVPTPDAKDVDALPYLHAVLMETLRLHAAIPGGQPRITPHDASLGNAKAPVTGLPSRVRVSSNAFCLHRNPEVFPVPHAWQPERWLDAHGKVDAGGEKARWFWAFGSGGRMCTGSNLAMVEMKGIVAAIWSNYRSILIDDSGMQHADGYLSEPKGSPDGNFLLLRFEAAS